ncbi:dihydrofolate reductase family protein [Pseudarthrobacter sp. S9]|uniref:dihydrofolate reductase family protein n=1 Tax=Pseudarthrobacter sp. S9 TaxID=3418421 RepID=UPI003D052C9C
MARIVLYMSMSLDGFISGPDDDLDQPLGRDGQRLHHWLRDGGVDPESHRPSLEPSATVFDEMMATGAVIAGRRTFDLARGWNGDHHDGVPVFVPTHAAPDGAAPGHVRFVTDGIESCTAQARAAAGDRDVMLHGATTAQESLRRGLLDEMEIQLVPTLLGRGRRLFDHLRPEHIALKLIRVLQAPDVAHLRYRVLSAGG